MIYFLLLTAFTVSIDSFLCGLSLSMSGAKKFPILLGITCTVFLMCCATNYGAYLFTDTITEKTASLGGIILMAIGFYNLFKKNSNLPKRSNNISLAFITGFGVGLDGAVANLSLSLMGINALYVPITIALMHLLLIYFGIVLSKTNLAKRFSKINFIAPLILILLGVYKVSELFL